EREGHEDLAILRPRLGGTLVEYSGLAVVLARGFCDAGEAQIEHARKRGVACCARFGEATDATFIVGRLSGRRRDLERDVVGGIARRVEIDRTERHLERFVLAIQMFGEEMGELGTDAGFVVGSAALESAAERAREVHVIARASERSFETLRLDAILPRD